MSPPSLPERIGGWLGELVGTAIAGVIILVVIRPVELLLGLLIDHTKAGLSSRPLDEERAQTVRLCDEATAAWRASTLSSLDREELLSQTVGWTLLRLDDVPLPVSVVSGITELIEDLLAEDGWLGPAPIDPERELSAEAAVALRNRLRLQIEQFRNADAFFPLWQEAVADAISGLLEELPAFIDDAKTSDADLWVPLIDLVPAPGQAVEQLVCRFFTPDIERTPLFHGLRTRLDANLSIASGLDPAKEPRADQKALLPSQATRMTAAELVEAYLAGTPFGWFLSRTVPYPIPDDVRFEHCHIVGGTGHGKTQLLQLFIRHDLAAVAAGKASLVIIDSQGDLVGRLGRLAQFSPEAAESLADRLVLVDPADIEHPVALNMFDVNLARLEGYGAVEREKILNGTVELYEYLFGALLGAELTQKQSVLFRYLARLMIVIPGATIQTLRELMEDGRPYLPYIEQLGGTAAHFFKSQFFSSSFAPTRQQVLRRLWGVLANSAFERMFSQPKNAVDLFAAMNGGSVILINTAKDLLKQEGCEIFGRFFIAMITQAAMERAAVPEGERTPTFVYIDEAQDYFDERLIPEPPVRSTYCRWRA